MARSKVEVYRAVSLPAGIDDESKVKSSFKNGVLELATRKVKKSYRKKLQLNKHSITPYTHQYKGYKFKDSSLSVSSSL